jgi:hypothetical protein
MNWPNVSGFWVMEKLPKDIEFLCGLGFKYFVRCLGFKFQAVTRALVCDQFLSKVET